MRLILIRHSETEWNKIGRYQGQSDTELSKEGKQQVELLLKREELNNNIDIIYTSDLKRAYYIAEVIAKKYNIKRIIKTDKLREMNYGIWEGKTIDEIKAEYPDLLNKWWTDLLSVKIPHAETVKQFQKRVIDWFKKEIIRDKEQGIKDKKSLPPNPLPLTTILIVSHGGPIKVIIGHCLGMTLPQIRNIRIDNASISILEWHYNRWQLILLNDTCHLNTR